MYKNKVTIAELRYMFIYTYTGTYTHIYAHIYTERCLIQDQCRISNNILMFKN